MYVCVCVCLCVYTGPFPPPGGCARDTTPNENGEHFFSQHTRRRPEKNPNETPATDTKPRENMPRLSDEPALKTPTLTVPAAGSNTY